MPYDPEPSGPSLNSSMYTFDSLRLPKPASSQSPLEKPSPRPRIWFARHHKDWPSIHAPASNYLAGSSKEADRRIVLVGRRAHALAIVGRGRT